MPHTDNIRSLYETVVADKYGGDYEFNRWYKNSRLRLDYYMTRASLKQQVDKLAFTHCLEVGPGPGTWTSVLFRSNVKAQFDLIDISEKMHRQFVLEMREQPNVSYRRGTFPDTPFKKGAYDLFFSSRAIEYAQDKEAFVRAMYDALVPGGNGILITKNPLLGLRPKHEVRPQHQGQIAPAYMESLLRQAGFSDIRLFPVIIRTPLWDRFSLAVSERKFSRCMGRPLSEVPLYRIESYLVHCIK